MVVLAEMSWAQAGLAFLVICLCLILMTVILLQRGRGMGLSGSFGGGGGSSAFGAKTGDVFTWITVGVTGAFLLLVIIGNFVFDMSVQAKPKLTESTPAMPAPSPIEMPALPPGGGADGGMSTDGGTTSKKFPIRLEQVPVDPNDPSKGTTFNAVPIPEGEAGNPPPGDARKVNPSGTAPTPATAPPAGDAKPNPAPSGETKSAEPAKPEAEKSKQPESGK